VATVTWRVVTALTLDVDPAHVNITEKINSKSALLERSLASGFASLVNVHAADVGVQAGALTLFCKGGLAAAFPWSQCPYQSMLPIIGGICGATLLLLFAATVYAYWNPASKLNVCFKAKSGLAGAVGRWDPENELEGSMFDGDEAEKRMLGDRAVTYREMRDALNQDQDMNMTSEELRQHWGTLPKVPVVGDRLLALAGKSFIKKGVEVYREGDIGVVDSFFSHTDGTYKMKITWERTSQISTSHVTTWATKYRALEAVEEIEVPEAATAREGDEGDGPHPQSMTGGISMQVVDGRGGAAASGGAQLATIDQSQTSPGIDDNAPDTA